MALRSRLPTSKIATCLVNWMMWTLLPCKCSYPRTAVQGPHPAKSKHHSKFFLAWSSASILRTYAATNEDSGKWSGQRISFRCYNGIRRPVLLRYADGGPAHDVTFGSIKVSLVSLFRIMDLDYLLVMRTCPGHSFMNPVERYMSILNLDLQSTGMMKVPCTEQDAEKAREHHS